MAIGIQLLARLGSPTDDAESEMKKIADWFREHSLKLDGAVHQGTVSESPAIFLKLHPGAEEVVLTLVDKSHIGISAATSSVGPGYHIFLVSLLKEWAGEFKATWLYAKEPTEGFGDETGYFISNDEQQVFKAMTDWLESVANLFFDGTFDSSSAGVNLSMPVAAIFEGDQPALTPLGPRGREWLQQTAHDGNAGKDFFAWWKPGLDAEYFLGRALTLMWSSVRWRPPVSETETATLKTVSESLIKACQLDPGLPYPWAEWAEIFNWLDASPPEKEMVLANAKGAPTIGYRRRSVVETLTGGWRMRMPGAFSAFEFDESHNLFSVDPPREIWFTSFRLPAAMDDAKFAAAVADLKKTSANHFIESLELVSGATVIKQTRESGEDYIAMHTLNITRSAKAVCTFVFAKPEDETWAVETWKSLRPPSAKVE